MRGDYYQCVKCDQFTVHMKDDRYCDNLDCSTNKATNKQPYYKTKEGQ